MIAGHSDSTQGEPPSLLYVLPFLVGPLLYTHLDEYNSNVSMEFTNVPFMELE